jgi:hypothetical protein
LTDFFAVAEAFFATFFAGDFGFAAALLPVLRLLEAAFFVAERFTAIATSLCGQVAPSSQR